MEQPSGPDPLTSLLADLELQAEGLHLAEREAEVGALGEAEYAEVTLVDRLMGSVGADLVVRLPGELVLHGRLQRAGDGWFALAARPFPWVVSTVALRVLQGLGERAVVPAARPITARLGLSSVLRRLAAERHECVVRLVDGSTVEGRLSRVGSDFAEMDDGRVVALQAVAALQDRG